MGPNLLWFENLETPCKGGIRGYCFKLGNDNYILIHVLQILKSYISYESIFDEPNISSKTSFHQTDGNKVTSLSLLL
jgi:hypothetical protein